MPVRKTATNGIKSIYEQILIVIRLRACSLTTPLTVQVQSLFLVSVEVRRGERCQNQCNSRDIVATRCVEYIPVRFLKQEILPETRYFKPTLSRRVNTVHLERERSLSEL